MPKSRTATVRRKTKETAVSLSVNLDGRGRAELSLGIPFLEHMLTLLAGHGLVDLRVRAAGDLQVDQHHLVEDLGLALGQALAKAWGDKRGLKRYGWAMIPMDESLVAVALDLSGRPFLNFGLKLRQRRLGSFDTELAPEFFRALCNQAGMTLHLVQLAGGNTHHVVEAAFKGLGRVLRQALERDPRQKGVPSTKGTL
jgi:imidazoleglycerol-phosphate dehydratase